MKTVLDNIKNIITYSDSEFLELLIGILHFAVLPIALWVEIPMSVLVKQEITLSVIGGFFQLYAVGTRDLTCRYIACYVSVVVSVLTVINYFSEDMLRGSCLGWVLIFIASVINLYRVGKQWTHKRYL